MYSFKNKCCIGDYGEPTYQGVKERLKFSFRNFVKRSAGSHVLLGIINGPLSDYEE
jgi:hypothetical protein